MGGSSSSSSTTNNYVDNSSITANQAGALLGIAGDGNKVGSVNVLDGGAIQSAFDFAGQAGDRAFDFAGQAGGKAFDFAESSNSKLMQAISETMGFAERAGNNAMRIAFESSQPGAAALNKQLIGIGVVAVSTVAAFAFLRGKK